MRPNINSGKNDKKDRGAESLGLCHANKGMTTRSVLSEMVKRKRRRRKLSTRRYLMQARMDVQET